MRVSTPKAWARDTAAPRAMPTSTEFTSQGTPGVRSPQVAKPQWPQLSPWAFSRVPTSATQRLLRTQLASRRKNANPRSSPTASMVQASASKSSLSTTAHSTTSTPLPLGAVRAATSIFWAMSNACAFRISRSS